MIEANKFMLGTFVITGVCLTLAVFFVLGFSELFKTKINFMTVFDESVQGLDVGAPVKYRGVTIGRVKRIAIRTAEGTTDNLVTVEMEAVPTAVDPVGVRSRHDDGQRRYISDSEHAKQEFFYEFFTKEVQRGLRCRIDLAGITGVRYVEIDYFDPKSPKIDFTPPPNTFYVPSTPSLFREISKSISESMIKIASIDFDKISGQLSDTLTSINQYLEDPVIKNMFERLDNISKHLEETTAAINHSLTKEAVEELLTSAKASLEAINRLADELEQQITMADIPRTSASLREALNSASQLKADSTATLTAINELVSTLDDDPSSLIHGKSQPEFDFQRGAPR